MTLHLDPAQLLYSLPTICDELPALTDVPAGPDDVLLFEDDWRQVELVAAVQEQAISDNLAAIRRTIEARSGLGFPEIHVRAEPRQPLAGLELTRDRVADLLGAGHRAASGLAFSADPRRIAGGFAYVGPASTVYGVERDGLLTTLALHSTSAPEGQERGWTVLRELADAHHAYVVDWLAPDTYPSVGAQRSVRPPR